MEDASDVDAFPLATRIAGQPHRNNTALTSVPLECPGAGCTTIPAGLFTTSTCSSSYFTSSGMSSGAASVGGVGFSATRMTSPGETRSDAFRATTPLTSTSPALMDATTRARVMPPPPSDGGACVAMYASRRAGVGFGTSIGATTSKEDEEEDGGAYAAAPPDAPAALTDERQRAW